MDRDDMRLTDAQRLARAAEHQDSVGAGRRRHVLTFEQLLSEHSVHLVGLRGKTLLRYMVLWDDLRDEWFADELAFLDFGGLALSLWAWQTYMCVSWDTPDLRGGLDRWQSDVFPALSWRGDAIPELDRMLGQPLNRLTVVEYQGELDALGFGTEHVYCEICNAGDKLGVRALTPSSPEFRLTTVWDDHARD